MWRLIGSILFGYAGGALLTLISGGAPSIYPLCITGAVLYLWVPNVIAAAAKSFEQRKARGFFARLQKYYRD